VTRARWALAGLLVALGGCASRGAVRELEEELTRLAQQSAQRDSALAVQLEQLASVQKLMLDSLTITREGLASLRGDISNDIYGVQQQLSQLTEATGQSQRRLSELRSQLEARGVGQPGRDTTAGAADTSGGAQASPSAEQIYQASLQQLRRGSMRTARSGLQQLLQEHPQDARVPDALYFIGESWQGETPDSAVAYYSRVVSEFPQSTRAASSLYKLGVLAERDQDRAAARRHFDRVVKEYPQSDEATLARDRLKSLR
jgi:tol-pal system protein YbgF